MPSNLTFRTETDTMGPIQVPSEKLWGANTERARQNLAISGQIMPLSLIHALARIKAAMIQAATDQGHIKESLGKAIENAASSVAAGSYDEHFPLDVFQTGSGTSSNMNVNEVIANIANVALFGKVGEYGKVNPNDHVNFGQSSNDTVPSALHLAALQQLQDRLLPALSALVEAWDKKAEEYAEVIKTGRTHLQDALPITFGHVFGGYVTVLSHLQDRLAEMIEHLSVIPLGGTAVGTGFQAPAGLPERAAEYLTYMYGTEIRIAASPAAYMAGRPVVTDCMGRLAALAMELQRMANDVRMMASGPRLGYGELTIPALQPGSSIMPGKVNPVVCESVVQVGMAVAGHNATVLAAAAGGQFELNVTFPVTAWALLDSMDILANVIEAFRTKVVEGLEVRQENIAADLDQSLAIATALISKIGYAEAAKVAYYAHKNNVTVAKAAVDMGVLQEDECDKWLDPARLVRRGRLEG